MLIFLQIFTEAYLLLLLVKGTAAKLPYSFCNKKIRF